MYRMTVGGVLAVVTLVSVAGGADDAAKVSEPDKTFMTEAANGGLMEVTLGKYASENASSDDVKTFGQRMVTDHSKANDELMELAKRKGVELPPKPNARHQEHIDQIQKLKGDDLDKGYMRMMVLDHRGDIEKFEKASKGADDADIKAWAAKTLPMLKEHVKLAEQTAKKVGVTVTPSGEEH